MSAAVDFYRSKGKQRAIYQTRIKMLDKTLARLNIEMLGRALGVPMQCFSKDEKTIIKKYTAESENIFKEASQSLEKTLNIAKKTEQMHMALELITLCFSVELDFRK